MSLFLRSASLIFPLAMCLRNNVLTNGKERHGERRRSWEPLSLACATAEGEWPTLWDPSLKWKKGTSNLCTRLFLLSIMIICKDIEQLAYRRLSWLFLFRGTSFKSWRGDIMTRVGQRWYFNEPREKEKEVGWCENMPAGVVQADAIDRARACVCRWLQHHSMKCLRFCVWKQKSKESAFCVNDTTHHFVWMTPPIEFPSRNMTMHDGAWAKKRTRRRRKQATGANPWWGWSSRALLSSWVDLAIRFHLENKQHTREVGATKRNWYKTWKNGEEQRYGWRHTLHGPPD